MAVDESNLCFIDCETTGLDPERHALWEIGLILDGQEYSYTLELTTFEGARADPMALKLTHFYERMDAARKTQMKWSPGTTGGLVMPGARDDLARRLAKLIGSRHLVGNVVSFDARFVGDFLRTHGSPPIWHYHLVDVESMAAGHLHLSPPWKSDDLSRQLGVDPEQFERHTALGDAQWARAMYLAVMQAHG